MQEEIIIEHKGSHIHAKKWGSIDKDKTLQFWQLITKTCEKYECYNILGESFSESKLSASDSYKLLEILRLSGVSVKHKIAWVFHSKETLNELKTAEKFMNESGQLKGRIFSNIEEAREWLLCSE